jgi:hypothetical protein
LALEIAIPLEPLKEEIIAKRTFFFCFGFPFASCVEDALTPPDKPEG